MFNGNYAAVKSVVGYNAQNFSVHSRENVAARRASEVHTFVQTISVKRLVVVEHVRLRKVYVLNGNDKLVFRGSINGVIGFVGIFRIIRFIGFNGLRQVDRAVNVVAHGKHDAYGNSGNNQKACRQNKVVR